MKPFFRLLQYLAHKLVVKGRPPGIRLSEVDSTSKVESGAFFLNSTMDRYSFCGYDCEIVHTDIGSFCSIAHGVVIGGTAHPIDWVGTSPVFYDNKDSVKRKFSRFQRDTQPRTTVGHDVWIGRNALIKQGVSVGTGSVVGMGAVVTKDVAPYTIVGGNPAREIRTRFDPDIVAGLLDSQWWLLADEDLEVLAAHIRDPGAFLQAVSARK